MTGPKKNRESKSVSVLSRKPKKASSPALEVPVFVRFWEEDGIWIASAVDLPVVAFGKKLKEARNNFGDAILTHFDTLYELGKLEEVIRQLRRKPEDCKAFAENITSDEFVSKFNAPVRDHELALA
jgi:predicted RNase H-like HicB family nuclease